MVLQLPVSKIHKQDLGRQKNMKMRAPAGLHVLDHIHRCPLMHNLTASRLSNCLILPYIHFFLDKSEISSWNSSRYRKTHPNLKYFNAYLPYLLKRGDITINNHIYEVIEIIIFINNIIVTINIIIIILIIIISIIISIIIIIIITIIIIIIISFTIIVIIIIIIIITMILIIIFFFFVVVVVDDDDSSSLPWA